MTTGCWSRPARACSRSSARTAAGASRPRDFPGIAVTAALRDPRDGAIYAALKHGHFGTKLHRSDDDGNTLDGDRRAGVSGRCRRRADAVPDLDAGGRRRRPARDGCGPARSRPGCSARTTAAKAGSSSSALWNVPERAKWFGGGYDDAGIHSISPDPRDARARVRRDLLRRRVGDAATTARAGRCAARA